RVWVRRSIFGVPGRQEAPFASLEEEQESLEMVIRGISVDIDVIQRWGKLEQTGARGVAAQIEGRNRGEEPYYVNMKINLPKCIESDIDIEFVQISNSAPLAIGQFSILDSGDEPRLAEETSSDRLKRGDEENSRPSLTIENNGVLVAWKAGLEGFPEKARLALIYRPNSNFSGARDVFEIGL
ncbi:hypothetical protein, partial [Salinicola aestuarinus]|uniref:hypothetical protein n=1 Tax=Salinicola aestuarinus TaxID=1949082 RepID=UPI00130027F2